MSNYKVETVEIRTKRNGDKYLHVKMCNETVGFFEDEDTRVELKEGDIISCKIIKKGRYFNGSNLKVVDTASEDLKIENKLNINRKKDADGSKLHAGSRIYHFEVKNTNRGDKYLVVTEQSGDKRNRIFIFEDHAEEFSQVLSKNLEKLNKK